MNRSRLLRFFALALAIASLTAGGGMAWQSQRAFAALHAEAEQVAAQRRQLKQQLAAVRAPAPRPDARTAVVAAITTLRERAASNPAPPRRKYPDGPRSNIYFPELLSDPHYAQLYRTWQKQQLSERYPPLSGGLALPAEELSRLKNLLVEKEIAFHDVDGILQAQAAAVKQPLDRNLAFIARSQTNAAFNAEIRRTFGEDVFTEIQKGPSVTAARQTFLEALTLRLSYSATPLTVSQADRLVEIYMQPRPRNSDPRRAISDEIITAAESILLPEQLATLQQLRREEEGRALPQRVIIRPPTAK